MLRIDRAEIRSHQTSQGYLRADAWLTRSGVFLYQNPDGSTRREYRPESEVFDSASLDTLQLVSLTDDHPPVLLDSANTKTYTVGKVGQDIERDGRWVRGTVQVDDASVQDKIRSGKAELSAGYTVDFEPTPGVTPDGLEYDGIQRNIRYNHLSVVDRGRASDGLEKAALKLDAAIQTKAVEPETRQRTDGVKTVKVKINGEKFDVDPDVAEALAAEREIVQEKMDKEAARADAAEEAKDQVQSKLDEATDADKFRAAVQNRVDLERKALDVLGDKEDLATKTDAEIMGAVVAKLCPNAKLDGRSDAYLRGRFDSALEHASTVKDAQDKTKKAIKDSAEGDAQPEGHDAIMKARADRIKQLNSPDEVK